MKSMPQDELIRKEAAEWVVKLTTETCSDAELVQLEQWKQQSPAHAKAFNQLYKLIGDVQNLKQHNLNSENNLIQKNIFSKNRKTTKNISALLLLISLGWVAHFLPWDHWTADVKNHTQTWQQQTLPDASVIRIAGETIYNIRYSAEQRKIELLQGNILIDVAKDKHRPFVIDTGHAQIQALGTRFIVQHHGNTVIVSMLESKTQIHNSAVKPIILAAGETLYLNDGHSIIQKNSPELLTQAWQNKKLVVTDMPLNQVLQILQSYHDSYYVYSDSQLKEQLVTAVLPLDQPEIALQLLSEHSGLKVTKYSAMFTRIEKD